MGYAKSIQAKSKSLYKDKRVWLIAIVTSVLIFGGMASLQAGFEAVEGIWEADVQIKGIGIDGNYMAFDNIVNPTMEYRFILSYK